MMDFYESQLNKLQDDIINGQSILNKEATKNVIATIRQIKSQLTKDLNKRDQITEKFLNNNTLDRLIHLVEHGEDAATTTGIPIIDNAWRWRLGETNIWTGYANDGKSAFLNFLTLIKCKMEKDSKAAIFSPENQPEEFFYLDFIHTILGRKPTPNDVDLVTETYEWLKANIFFVYPKGDFTLANIHEEFAYHAEVNGANICVLDPYLKVHHEYNGDAEHHYVAKFMTNVEKFARSYNVSYHIVAHQRTPQLDHKTGNYIKPDAYGIKGGGSFMDGVDNLLTLFRPFKKENFTDPTVVFESQKIKKQRLVARPNQVELKFNFKTQRYETPQGTDLYELAINDKPPF